MSGFMTPEPLKPMGSPPQLDRRSRRTHRTSGLNRIKPINLFPSSQDGQHEVLQSPPSLNRFTWNPDAFTTPNQVFNLEGLLDAPLKKTGQLNISKSELDSVKSSMEF
jgi:hypothetical protein